MVPLITTSLCSLMSLILGFAAGVYWSTDIMR